MMDKKDKKRLKVDGLEFNNDTKEIRKRILGGDRRTSRDDGFLYKNKLTTRVKAAGRAVSGLGRKIIRIEGCPGKKKAHYVVLKGKATIKGKAARQ